MIPRKRRLKKQGERAALQAVRNQAAHHVAALFKSYAEEDAVVVGIDLATGPDTTAYLATQGFQVQAGESEGIPAEGPDEDIDLTDPIPTRPGESLIDSVNRARACICGEPSIGDAVCMRCGREQFHITHPEYFHPLPSTEACTTPEANGTLESLPEPQLAHASPEAVNEGADCSNANASPSSAKPEPSPT